VVARAGKKEGFNMTTDRIAGQLNREPGAVLYRETLFERHPWERISQSNEERFPVTQWIGIKALVVSLPLPGVDPDGLRLSVHGTRLILQAPDGTGTFSKDIDLPYAVEMPPILVKDEKDTLYILLQRK
jgi:HSP20 family molecular chaperone IbpA